MKFPPLVAKWIRVVTPLRLDRPGEIASLLHQKWQAGLDGGVLVANPVPALAEIPAAELKTAIDAALQQAEQKGVKGKAVTPFLLDYIRTHIRALSGCQ